MVAVFDIRIDLRIPEVRPEWFGNGNIIDPPAFVLGAYRGKTLAPPAIAVWFFMKFAKSVDPSVGIKFIHPRSFFRQKARSFFIASGIVNVYLLVCNVIISTENDVWVFLPQSLHIVVKFIQPLVLVRLSFITCGA